MSDSNGSLPTHMEMTVTSALTDRQKRKHTITERGTKQLLCSMCVLAVLQETSCREGVSELIFQRFDINETVL